MTAPRDRADLGFTKGRIHLHHRHPRLRARAHATSRAPCVPPASSIHPPPDVQPVGRTAVTTADPPNSVACRVSATIGLTETSPVSAGDPWMELAGLEPATSWVRSQAM